MNLPLTVLVAVLITGIGATVLLDLWSLLRQQCLGIAPPDYGLVGRWMAGWSRGVFLHDSIMAADPVRGELAIGWIAHYLIGVSYAVMLVALAGTGWLRQPSLGPALLVGIVTVAAPFLIMQPGMGAGVAASRTPDPSASRLHSLLSHAIFGLGMYLSARIVPWLFSS